MPESRCTRRSVLKMGLSMAVVGLPRQVVTGGLFRGGEAEGRPLSLLAIQLRGGNDALNTVVPKEAAWYREFRGELALSDPESLLPLDGKFYFNSSLSSIARRFREGQVAIFLGTGIPGQTKSHTLASEKIETEFLSAFENGTSKSTITRIEIDGFDTHCRQRPDHDRLLVELDRLVEREHSRWDLGDRDQVGQRSNRRLVTLVYSEFGRSLYANDEGGTDHGVGGCAFLIGDSVRGGIYGDYRLNENRSLEKFPKKLLENKSPGDTGADLDICFDLREIARALRAERNRLDC